MPRFAVVTLLALSLMAVSCGSQPVNTSTFLTPDVDTLVSRPVPESTRIGQSVAGYTLPDLSRAEAPFEMKASPGGVLVMYFGFVSCPDVCPTTLWDLKQALGQMEDGANRVEVAMATIDPERDSDATMLGYLQSFFEDGHPLRTDDVDALTAVGDAFGADFDVIKLADGGVEVLHTAYLYAIDDTGLIQAVWPFGAEPEAIAAGLSKLLASYG